MQKVELLKRIASNPSIPSPPTVVLHVLDKASKPDCTIGDLCQLIQMDPGMSGRVLRIVNSAMFGLSRPVTSIQRALAVVGLNSTRLLMLAISLPEMQQKMHKADAGVKQRYWKASVAGAIVARELAHRMRAGDPEDDMAAGLLRDLGELILLQLMPGEYQKVLDHPDEALVKGKINLEEEHCGLNHAEVSAFILDRWRLPPEITEAIRHHHQPDAGLYSTPSAESRARRLQFATRASDLLLHPDQPLVLKELREIAQSQYQMTELQLHEFLLPLSKKITDFAALLQIDIGAASDYHDILTRAGEELVNLTVANNLDNQRTAETSRRAETEARRWRQEAVFDSLTKVFNRRYLEAKMREYLRADSSDGRHGRSRPVVPRPGRIQTAQRSVLAIRSATWSCKENRRLPESLKVSRYAKGDIVARYGGDEFCVLTDAIDEVGLHSFSRRIWTKINDLTTTQGDCEGKVGASIGSVYFEPASQWDSAEQILAAADRAMYIAKSQGKNRVVFWNSLTTVTKAAPSTGDHRRPVGHIV